MRTMIGLAALTALFVTGTAQAQRAVQDLVGTRAAGGEQELQSRGWVHIKTEKGDDRSWSYWWQPSQRKCITVAVLDGRFDAVTDSLPVDCNQRGKGSSAAAVAAGVGIAAIIAAAALAHKQHNHDNGQHYGDEGSESGFERGYRDGLYSQAYHNYDRSEPYTRGYEAGTAQRSRETDYRAPHRVGAAGYRPSVDLSDLVDARGSGDEPARVPQRGRIEERGDVLHLLVQRPDAAMRSDERVGRARPERHQHRQLSRLPLTCAASAQVPSRLRVACRRAASAGVVAGGENTGPCSSNRAWPASRNASAASSPHGG